MASPKKAASCQVMAKYGKSSTEVLRASPLPAWLLPLGIYVQPACNTEKDAGPHLEAFWNLNEGSKIQSTKITSINLLMKAAADLASIRIVSARTCVSVQTTANEAASLTAFSQFGRFVNRSYAGVDPNLQSIKPRQDRCQS